MLSPEPVFTTAAPPPNPPGGTRAHLKLVKSGGRGELTALEREFLPPLLEIQETPPSPAHRTLLWTVVALVVCLLIWAWFGHVSIVSTAPGKFIPDGRVKQLQPLEASIVKAIHVKEGQHVQQGEVLVELDPTISAAEMQADAEKYDFNRLEQARLTAELTHGKPQYAATGQSSARITLEEQTRRVRSRHMRQSWPRRKQRSMKRLRL